MILVGEMRDRETVSLALTAAETGHLVMGTLHTSSAPKTIDRIVDVFPGDEKDMVRTMLAGSLQAIIAQLLVRTPDGGRAAAHEILVGTGAVKALIRENKIPQVYSMMQIGSKFGMQTMQDAVEKLVLAGTISREDAARITATAESEGQAASSAAAAAKTGPAPAPTAKNYNF